MSGLPRGEVEMDGTTEVELTFLIADLAGFTALTETHGNLHAAHVVTRFLELVRATLQPGTRLVERVGDAVLIVAEDTVSAVRTAIALRDAAEREPLFPLLRIGVHGGPVVQLGGSYFGTPLNLTARLASYAKPDQILCTERVAQSGADLPDVEFRALGPVRHRDAGRRVPGDARPSASAGHPRRSRLPHAGEREASARAPPVRAADLPLLLVAMRPGLRRTSRPLPRALTRRSSERAGRPTTRSSPPDCSGIRPARDGGTVRSGGRAARDAPNSS